MRTLLVQGDWNISVQPNYLHDGVDVWITRSVDGENVEVVGMTDDNRIEGRTILQGSHMPDGFRPIMLYREIAQALADALAEKGYRTDRDAKIEGTLEATRAHLSDLRELLEIGRADE